MKILKKIGESTNNVTYEYLVDTQEDFYKLNTTIIPMGSTCYIIDTGENFIINGSGYWEIYKNGNSGSNDSNGSGSGVTSHSELTGRNLPNQHNIESITGLSEKLQNLEHEVPNIPDKLPNPYKLQLTGAVEAEYDGSKEITVNIPTIKGESGSPGADGKSAYQIAIDNGFEGTEADWLESLKGEPGRDGSPGENGADGAPGEDGTPGIDGKSAYQIAVDNGFDGTEVTWLESLKGKPGADGTSITAARINENGYLMITYSTGEVVNVGKVVGEGGSGGTGADGKDGTGIQSITVNSNGELVVSLTDGTISNLGRIVGADGQPGDKGDPGDSAYEVALKNGFEGTEQEWLASLKGEPGIQGEPGQDGQPGADGAPGTDGEKGETGVGISSIEQTVTSEASGGVNRVTVTKTDGTTSTFEVRNGIQGEQGPEGPQGPQGIPGSVGIYVKSADETDEQAQANATAEGATIIIDPEKTPDPEYVTVEGMQTYVDSLTGWPLLWQSSSGLSKGSSINIPGISAYKFLLLTINVDISSPCLVQVVGSSWGGGGVYLSADSSVVARAVAGTIVGETFTFSSNYVGNLKNNAQTSSSAVITAIYGIPSSSI